MRILVSNDDGYFAPGIAAQSGLYHQLFTALLTEIGRPEPEIEAHLLFATLDGVFQHYVLDPETYPLDAVIERLVLQHGGAPPANHPEDP